jgi:histidinol-phosphate/aromatic aminotransferase/cobyric acid decarboxylase-like protein
VPFEPRIHGGAPEGVVDFSVSVNAYGPHPEVLAAARAAAFDRYPDPTARRARIALAGMTGVDPERIVVGNGAADLLWAVARACVPRGARVFIAEPTFSEFGAAIGDATLASRPAEADLIYLCNPNNPTGTCAPLADIAARAADRPQTVFVLDESFLSLSERADEAQTLMPDNVIRVRSLTKDHALPGLRVGYLIAAPDTAAAIDAARPAWSASAPAQAAAITAAAHSDFVADSRRRLLADRDLLVAALRERGHSPQATATHFFLLPTENATALRARLLDRGVAVRDCTSFGLPHHVRIAARPDFARLLEAL